MVAWGRGEKEARCAGGPVGAQTEVSLDLYPDTNELGCHSFTSFDMRPNLSSAKCFDGYAHH